MPNLENIRKWVKALRSGKYQQGQDRLRSKYNKYCCLGVACEVAIQNGVKVEVSLYDSERAAEYHYDGEGGFLPEAVQNWFEFNSDCPIIGNYLGENENDYPNISATEANDDANLSFLEIADLLERHYLSE